MQRLASLFLLSFLAACSHIGDAFKDSGSGAAGATSPDAGLMRDIAQANLAEIATGKLAVAKAQSPDVRRFGQLMIEDHSMLQREGAAVATANGWPVPSRPDERHQAAAKKLESMSGESFDRAYMEQMVKDHAQTLQLLERTAQEANDKQLRGVAQKAIPHVRQHLDLAKRLAGDVIGLAPRR
jgi:putative membrane protein